jgi:uncharacterized protein (TIGR03067 family)
MRLNVRAGVAGVVFALFVLSHSPARADDKDRFQGTWKVTYAAYGDKVATPAQLRNMTVTIEGNKFTYMDGDLKEVVHFSLKPNEKPYKVIEFFRGPADNKLHWHGVYEFSQGKIKLCWGPAEADRPRSFSPKKDQRFYTIEKK